MKMNNINISIIICELLAAGYDLMDDSWVWTSSTNTIELSRNILQN